MNQELITKYIAGQATAAEKEIVLNWIEENPENRQKFNRQKNAWIMCQLPKQQANENDIRHYSQLIRHRKQNHRIWIYGVAASLLLFLSINILQKIDHYQSELFFLQNQEFAQLEYHTNKGVKGRVTLPDGSTVWLNSDSELKCPGKFTGDKREVWFSGEAYFDVIKNPDKPMVIRLDKDITVMVRGTKFNLTSYENDTHISALLLSGNITVLKKQNDTEEEIAVKPNERISIEKEDKQVVNLSTPVETLPILGWKDGWLIFDETPMSEVLKKLERWHGINFIVEDPEILNQKFTARFHQESISQILEMLNHVSLLKYKLQDKTAILYKY